MTTIERQILRNQLEIMSALATIMASKARDLKASSQLMNAIIITWKELAIADGAFEVPCQADS